MCQGKAELLIAKKDMLIRIRVLRGFDLTASRRHVVPLKGVLKRITSVTEIQ